MATVTFIRLNSSNLPQRSPVLAVRNIASNTAKKISGAAQVFSSVVNNIVKRDSSALPNPKPCR